MSDSKNGSKEYRWESVQGHTGRVKTFGSWRYKDSHLPALCQIKMCKEVAKWAVEFKGKTIVLCFAHGEDC